MNTIRKIGPIKKEIVELLNIDIDYDTPILIGKSNEEHIKTDILQNMINTSNKLMR